MCVLPNKGTFCHVFHQPVTQIEQAVNVMITFLVATNQHPLHSNQDEHPNELLHRQNGHKQKEDLPQG